MIITDVYGKPILEKGKVFKGKGGIVGFCVVAVDCLDKGMLGPPVFA